ncbi:oligoribonuclease [Enterobacteriaceae endosymbiont of Macroplea appendiculata]|uniref:oligoribonuclease n=1 Tax=Enterobacteriaceae endosymbiont of Macroplea appendiculata TaxID=2675790 RepID=UPI0014491204|nr:oligoribonuclease [Enterobacteriaceae endosymbiont of Macroplea appendiculata]QJC30797.1 oligoribonuclease [Enterobacteriaceae endosymbiont of Macroplea appendiculata]
MFIWIDLEMTGLNLNIDRILEIAVVITDVNLKILYPGMTYSVYQKKKILNHMNSWNYNTHTNNGLIDKVQHSTLNELQIEILLLNFLKLHIPPNTSPMCGNSIYQDRRFLSKYMPRLEKYFHYRNIDVSSFKEIIKQWYPDIFIKLKKKQQHRAIDDIYESIRELQFYKKFVLKQIKNIDNST